MATHSSVLAWRIPGTGEPGGLLSMGSHRVGHDWSDLAAAAAVPCNNQQRFFLPCSYCLLSFISHRKNIKNSVITFICWEKIKLVKLVCFCFCFQKTPFIAVFIYYRFVTPAQLTAYKDRNYVYFYLPRAWHTAWICYLVKWIPHPSSMLINYITIFNYNQFSITTWFSPSII